MEYSQIMKKLSFDNLTPTQFEEFCYDLLGEIGLVNLNWRKGTGYETSPSDSGRDIECEFFTKVGKKQYSDKWFVECKHHKQGISVSEISGFSSWLIAEKPNKGLIIASNYLSNPCRDWIEKFNNTNKPLKIEYWELKDLENFAKSYPSLLRKYKLSDGLDFVEIMHPLHLQYISEIGVNTLDYFFAVIEELDAFKRNKILENIYFYVIDPKMRSPVTGKEKMGDLFIEKCDYNAFKEKCYSLLHYTGEEFLTKSITNLILASLFHLGNKTLINKNIIAHTFVLQRLKEKLNFAVDEEKKEILEHIKFTENFIKNLDEHTKEYYSLYFSFCNKVLPKLIKEPEILIKEIQKNFS
jgi:hypothetical protein